MAELSYEVDFNGWTVPLQMAARNARDIGPALQEVGAIGVGIMTRNIEDQGGTINWPELAPSTLRDRARKGFAPGPMLIRTRDLMRSLASVVGVDYVDFGSTMVKSWTLFLGSRVGKKPNVPARSPFGFTTTDEQSIVGAFVRHILGGLVRGAT